MKKLFILQLVVLILFLIALYQKTKTSFGFFFWTSCLLFFYIYRSTITYKFKKCCKNYKYKTIYMFSAIVVSLMCIMPMNLSPVWSDQVESYKKQYEYLADAILAKHINFNYRADPVLLWMNNPYNPEERKAFGAKVQWDHAFYKGKYFSYFGVVPVFLVFIPFKIITGTQLASYHATQLFVFISILCLHYLFWIIASNSRYKKIPFIVNLCLASSFSFIIFYYAIGTPAMYCTAITSGICFEIMCMIFYVKYILSNSSRPIYLFFGALCGALIFGCRPPITMINIVAIPVLINIIKRKHINHLFILLVPYIIVVSLIFIYNYIRFDNVLEFGQSYQLTLADMKLYSSDIWNKFNALFLFKELMKYFFSTQTTAKEWFELHLFGVYINFPILLFSFLVFFKNLIFVKCNNTIYYIYLCIFLSVIISATIDIVGCAYIIEKYHMDTYCAIAVVTYVAICYSYDYISSKVLKYFNFIICMLCFCTLFSCCYFSFMPYDWNFIVMNYNIRDSFEDVLWFNFF